jgi:hypothetical protein
MENKKNFLSNIAVTIALLSLSSCASIVNNHPIATLYHYSKDCKVTENGKELNLVESFAAHKKAGYAQASYGGEGSGGTNYYIPGIQLEARPKKHTITIEKDGKTANVIIKGKTSGFYFILDLFLTGPIGLIIDASTAKWRVASPSYIDVTAALGETAKVSRHKLKKEFLKNQAKK